MSTEECVDFSENFKTSTRFSSREELIDWVRGVGKENNVVVTIKSSSKSGTHASGRVDLECKKSGKPRKRETTDILKQKRQSRSNKLNCPFHLRGCEQLSGGWLLHVVNGKHNHEVGKHVKSPPVRLRKDDIMMVERLSKSMSPKQILNCLQSLKGYDSITIKQIYNAKIKVKSMGEHVDTQVEEENLQDQMIKVQEYLFQEAINNIKNRPEKERAELYYKVIEVAFSDKSVLKDLIVKPDGYATSSMSEGERCTSATILSESSPLYPPPIDADGHRHTNLCGRGTGPSQDCGLVHSNTFTLFSSGQFFSYIAYIPSFMAPYVHGWLDVKDDGNCGFRAIARNLYEDQERWMHVRQDLYLDVDSRPGLYERSLKGFKSTRELCNALSHWSCDDAPIDKWMSSDMGFVIATRYNKILVILSSQESQTFFPLRSSMDNRDPDGEIVIAHLHNKGRFIAVDMFPNFPLPPLSVMWHPAHDSSVANLPLSYSARFQKYIYLRGSVQPPSLQNIDFNSLK